MDWLIPAYYITVGVLVAVPVVGVANALIVDDRERRNLYLLFAAMGILGQLFQLLSIGRLTATNLNDALAMLRWSIHVGNIGLVLLGVFITLYTTHHINRWLLAYMVGGCLLLTVLNTVYPYTLNYVYVDRLSLVQMPWGESFARIEGQSSTAELIRRLFAFSILFWMLYCVWRCWRQKQRVMASALVMYAVLQILAAVLTLTIEEIYGVKISLGGFAFCLLVLIVWFELARSVHNESQVAKANLARLATETWQRQQAERENIRLSQVFMQSPLPTQLIDFKGQVQDVNKASLEFWQRDLSAGHPTNLLHLLQDHGIDGQELLASVRGGGLSTFGPVQMVPEGPVTHQTPWMEISVFPLDTTHPQAVVMLEDVSSRVFVEQAIEHIARDVSEQSGAAFYAEIALDLHSLIDADQVFIGWLDTIDQPSHVETVALVEGERLRSNIRYPLSGTPCETVVSGRACVYPRNVQALFPEDGWLQELNINSYAGAPIYDREHRVIGILAALYCEDSTHLDSLLELLDIYAARIGAEAHRMQSEQRIRQLAYEDYLTGLPNRAQFHEALHRQLKHLHQQQERATLMLVDLDHFKRINDALGHDVGDEVIRQIGHRLQQQFASAQCLVASLGGDEFVMLDITTEASSEAAVQMLTTAVLEAIRVPVKVGDHILTIEGSIGVVLLPDQGDTVIEALRAAEIALYRAKDGGRGLHVIFDPNDRDVIREKLQIERALRTAIEQQQLALWFQPQIDMQSRVCGAEMLLRWDTGKEQAFSPDVFIPIAEESGLIHQLGDWVLGEALAFIDEHPALFADRSFHLSVNVSAWQFGRSDFVENLINRVQCRDKAACLLLELTETSLLTDIDETRYKLQRLRDQGFAIALDDFGTGYSSLAYLRDLPLDELKIDKAFVRELDDQPDNPLVESMIAIGHNMKMRVIAEGVETDAQFQRLKQFGCQYFQGYLHARPMPASAFLVWLEQRRSDIKATEVN